MTRLTKAAASSAAAKYSDICSATPALASPEMASPVQQASTFSSCVPSRLGHGDRVGGWMDGFNTNSRYPHLPPPANDSQSILTRCGRARPSRARISAKRPLAATSCHCTFIDDGSRSCSCAPGVRWMTF